MAQPMPRTPAPGAVLGGRLQLESSIGEGGMGVVFRARPLGGSAPLAVKVLTATASKQPDALRRFENEARAIGQLTTNHVVRVHETGTTDDGLPFYAMELLEGTDLARLIATRGALPPAEAVDYLVQAADAVAEAHAHGIVHRDLKPSNLFLARQDGGTILKVLDFGISKLGGPEGFALTATGEFLGSAHYVAPEQLKNAKDADARADVWSLGVILYEMLAGAPPFEGGSFGAVFVQVLNSEPQPLRERRPGLPDGLAAAVERCLRKARDERFASVRDLVRVLAPYASDTGRVLASRIAPPLVPEGLARTALLPADFRAAPVSIGARSAPAPAPAAARAAARPSGAAYRRPVVVATVGAVLLVLAGLLLVALAARGGREPPQGRDPRSSAPTAGAAR